MKSIEMKSELKDSFLQACKRLDLEAVELKKIVVPGRIFFWVSKPNISQQDLFNLGVYFLGLVSGK